MASSNYFLQNNNYYRPTTSRTESDYSNYSTVSDSSQYSDEGYDEQQIYQVSTSSQASALFNTRWSDWVWSPEHNDYYRYRYHSHNGDPEYEWGTRKQSSEVGTVPDKVSTYSSTSRGQSLDNQPMRPIGSGRVYNMHWLDSNVRGGSAARKETWVRGTIHGVEVFAFPDSCSSLNIISWDFVSRFGINHVQQSEQQPINLPTGGTVQSMGTVTLPFCLEGETKARDITFSVLKRCVHHVVLGSSFLNSTKTLTTYKHRIQRGIRGNPHIPRICLTGDVSYTVTISINGHTVEASPDSGSDAMLMSASFANAHGFPIDQNYNAMATLECIDGSLIKTCGMVSGVRLKFGPSSVDSTHNRTHTTGPGTIHEQPEEWSVRDASPKDTYICSFYVVADLICPVILSADFLYDTNAFNACKRFFNYSNSRGPSTMFLRKGIDPPLLVNYNRTVNEIQTEELNLRGDAEDWIHGLRRQGNSAAADTYTEAERQFRQRWNQWLSAERQYPVPGGTPRVPVPQRTWSIGNQNFR